MAGHIPRQFIDDLLQRTDIVDVIDARVPLTKGGKDFKARCPFHEEKSPSFTVSQTKQFYHCFGCGANGTAISFLMEFAHMEFPEAIEELAAQAGLTVPASENDRPTNNHATHNLLGLLAQASRLFQTQLRQHPKSNEAIEYLKQRGLSGEIAKSFELGFAPDEWDTVLKNLGNDSSSSGLAIQSGLVIKNEQGKLYDRFRNRVMFPIHDYRGRIVAFGGRVLGDGEPKYLNSPETPVFHKGSELYGLYRARGGIREAQKSVVVEGYMDVVALAQYGINNAVATLGTATTSTHLQRLFRMAQEIVFCFDGDRAGRNAAWRALETTLTQMQDGHQVSFLFLPDGEDPDSIVRQEGADGFLQRVATAIPLSEFFFMQVCEGIDLKRLDGRARLVDIARPQINQLADGTFKQLMFDQLARLSQTQLNDIVTPTSPKLLKRRVTKSKPTRTSAAGDRRFSVGSLIELLLKHPSLHQLLMDKSELLNEIDLPGIEVLNDLVLRLQQQPTLSTAAIVEGFRATKYHSHLEKLASRDHQIEDANVEEIANDIITRLTHKSLTRQIDALLSESNIDSLSETEKTRLKKLYARRQVLGEKTGSTV